MLVGFGAFTTINISSALTIKPEKASDMNMKSISGGRLCVSLWPIYRMPIWKAGNKGLLCEKTVRPDRSACGTTVHLRSATGHLLDRTCYFGHV